MSVKHRCHVYSIAAKLILVFISDLLTLPEAAFTMSLTFQDVVVNVIIKIAGSVSFILATNILYQIVIRGMKNFRDVSEIFEGIVRISVSNRLSNETVMRLSEDLPFTW